MKFSPKPIEETKAKNLWPKGVYHFEVLDAEDKISAAGNEMIVLRLRISADNGRDKIITDYLLEKALWKLSNFAAATGLVKEYESGEMQDYVCVGKHGQCKVDVSKPKEGYEQSNIVVDYIVPEVKPVTPKVKPTQTIKDLDDDVPF